jgi:hypothetical protein
MLRHTRTSTSVPLEVSTKERAPQARSREVVSIHRDRRLHAAASAARAPAAEPSLKPAFLRELRDAFPFQIRRIQVDNGTEFPLAFALTWQELGVRVRDIRPRRPELNGKLERSHRLDDEEFWTRYAGKTSTSPWAIWLHGNTATTTSASRWR